MPVKQNILCDVFAPERPPIYAAFCPCGGRPAPIALRVLGYEMHVRPAEDDIS